MQATPMPWGMQTVKLVGDMPWDEVARWCGGRIENERDEGGEWHSWISIPQDSGEPLKAYEYWTIIRYPDGVFRVLRDPLMPMAMMYPALWNKLMETAHAGCAVCGDDPQVGCRERDDAEYQTAAALRVVVDHLDLSPEPDASRVVVPC